MNLAAASPPLRPQPPSLSIGMRCLVGSTPPPAGAPDLLSPTVQSVPSSAVSTPSAFEVSDDYPPLGSSESLPLPTQTSAQSYMAQLYGYQSQLEPASWPSRSSYQMETALETVMSPDPSSLPQPTMQTLSNTGPNMAYAQITPAQAQSDMDLAMGLAMSLEKPSTPIAEESPYALLRDSYRSGNSHMGHQNNWQ